MPNLRNLPLGAWLGITGVLLVLLGGGAWGVHSLLDYTWLQCLMLAPVFVAAILGLLALGLYMTT